MSLYISGLIDPRGVPGVTWTRASDAWRRDDDDSNGERWSAIGGNGIPRDQHLPAPGVPRGVLIEPARTNRCVQSAALTTAPWLNDDGGTFTANDAVAPDGTTAAEKGDDPSAVARPRQYQAGLGFADADVVAMSCFGRLGTSPMGKIAHFNGAGWTASANISASTWARSSFSDTVGTDATSQWTWAPADAGAGPGPTVATTGTGWAWGAQVELGRWASSYIPTVAAAVTRAADVCSVDTGTLAAHSFGASFGAVRMVWVPAFGQADETGAVVLLGLDANTDFRYDGADDKFKLRAGGATVLESAAQTFTANSTVFIFDITWNGPRCNFSVIKDGTAQGGFQSKTAWVLPTLGATIAIGGTAAGASQAGGTYSNIYLGMR